MSAITPAAPGPPESLSGVSRQVTARETDATDAVTDFRLRQGQTEVSVLTCGEAACTGDSTEPVGPDEAGGLFDATVAFWRSWISRSRYSGRWREMAHRSALP